METYTCTICGKTHKIFPEFDSPLPQILRNIDEEEYDKRVEESNGQYFIDKELMLMKGTIQIHLKGEVEPFFYWQVWVSVTKENFNKTLEDVKKVGVSKTDSLCFKGQLESELYFYDRFINLSVDLKSNGKDVSYFFVEIVEDSILKEDQINGVSKERVMEVMNDFIYHSRKHQNLKSDKPFSERFDEVVKAIQQKSISKGDDFIINISSTSGSHTLFQIISSRMLENPKESLGFGLHLSFDDSFSESIEELRLFKQTTYYKDFDNIILDDIATSQIDIGNDLERLKGLVAKLYVDVYQEDFENIIIHRADSK